MSNAMKDLIPAIKNIENVESMSIDERFDSLCYVIKNAQNNAKETGGDTRIYMPNIEFAIKTTLGHDVWTLVEKRWSISNQDFDSEIAKRIREGNIDNINLTYVDFEDMDLSNTDLRGIDMTGSSFVNANLSGAKLSDAILEDTFFNNANLQNADLSNVVLDRANMAFADLTNANLTQASMRFAIMVNTTLENAILNYSDLSGASLCCANMKSADLVRTEMWRTNLTNAIMIGSTLEEAKLCDKNQNETILPNGMPWNESYDDLSEFTQDVSLKKEVPQIYFVVYAVEDRNGIMIADIVYGKASEILDRYQDDKYYLITSDYALGHPDVWMWLTPYDMLYHDTITTANTIIDIWRKRIAEFEKIKKEYNE